jgi:hypothetical protein
MNLWKILNLYSKQKSTTQNFKWCDANLHKIIFFVIFFSWNQILVKFMIQPLTLIQVQ